MLKQRQYLKIQKFHYEMVYKVLKVNKFGQRAKKKRLKANKGRGSFEKDKPAIVTLLTETQKKLCSLF